MFKFDFGQEVKDQITGFKGVITGRVEYITGCIQYVVTPPAKDGKVQDAEQIDEVRLAPTSKTISLNKKEVKEKPAGPQKGLKDSRTRLK